MLSYHIIVNAPADAVCAVVGRQFDRIGEWATAIPASAPVPAPVADPSPAPVAGRVCETGIALLPRITEMIVEYDDTARTVTYRAEGMPAYVTAAQNTWTVIPLDEWRSRVTLRARFDTRGLLGWLARWLILAQVRRTSRYLADDLRHYVEHGTPSPRKQRQLRA
jgi:hypothetical protein